MTDNFDLWREITIPTHTGTNDLFERLKTADMHVEHWAESVLLSRAIPPRERETVVRIARISNKALGFTEPLVTIQETKQAAKGSGLRFLSHEEILTLRLAYADQPVEWMRIAMETHVDEDGSYLDFAIVNDGVRRDLRTTWAFPQNAYQLPHEWFWVLD